MADPTCGTDRAGCRSKRFLTPSQRYEIFLRLVRQEVTMLEAAETWQWTAPPSMRIRTVAEQGALDALPGSRPGRPAAERDHELEAARPDAARLGEALKEMGGQADAGGEKRSLGLSGRVPSRVDEATTEDRLPIADAVDAGWSLRRACRELEVGERRVWRWSERRGAGELAKRRPGGSLSTGGRADEVAGSWPSATPSAPTAGWRTGSQLERRCGRCGRCADRRAPGGRFRWWSGADHRPSGNADGAEPHEGAPALAAPYSRTFGHLQPRPVVRYGGPADRRDDRPGAHARSLSASSQGRRPRVDDHAGRHEGLTVSGTRLVRILDRVRAAAGDGTAWLCGVCVDVVGVTGAGVMLMSGDIPRGSLCSSDPVSRLMEDLQFTLGEGPCVDAYEHDLPVAEPDLAANGTGRWAAFSPPVVEAGALAVFGLPLRVGAVRLGALNLYRDRPGPLSDDQHADSLVLAGVVARSFLVMQAHASPGAVADGIEAGADLHLVVHQAAGMVSAHLGVDVAEAFVRLRAHAFAEGRSLDDVARDVVAGRLRLG